MLDMVILSTKFDMYVRYDSYNILNHVCIVGSRLVEKCDSWEPSNLCLHGKTDVKKIDSIAQLFIKKEKLRKKTF